MDRAPPGPAPSALSLLHPTPSGMQAMVSSTDSSSCGTSTILVFRCFGQNDPLPTHTDGDYVSEVTQESEQRGVGWV